MIKVVGKSVGAGANSFFYEQILIVAKGDTLTQHVSISLVFVNISQTYSEHIHKRIPPLQHFYKCEQQDIERMKAANVPLLVQNDFVALLITTLPNQL